jgi:hypothetical protein
VTRQRVNAEGTRLRIDALRQDGTTAYALSKTLGVDPGTVLKIARGQRFVNRDTAVAVYVLFGVRCGVGLSWDEEELDAPGPGSSTGDRWTRRPSVDLAEDLDDLASQLGFARAGTVTGWEPRARRHVAARLGMSVRSFDRAVYRGRAYQRKQLVERSAA